MIICYKEIIYDYRKNIEDIFFFPENNSGITEDFITQNKGDVPVYGSRKDGKPMGYIKDNIQGKRYFKNCLTWNRNGSVGYTFYREHKFLTTDDCRALVLKPEYLGIFDYNYLKFKVQEAIFNNGYAWDDKAGKEKIKTLSISIPDNIETQQKIAKKYANMEKIKNQFEFYYNTLKTSIIKLYELENQNDCEQILVKNLIESIRINKYTKKLSQIGKYPIYSQSSGISIEGYIDNLESYIYNTDKNVILFGEHNLKTKVITGSFGIKDNLKVFKIREKFEEIIIPEYIAICITQLTPFYGYARHFKYVMELNIPIPEKLKQINIVKKYYKLLALKTETYLLLEKIKNAQIKIDI